MSPWPTRRPAPRALPRLRQQCAALRWGRRGRRLALILARHFRRVKAQGRLKRSSGGALAEAAVEKKGIVRYGFSYLPMDEALLRVALDLSGRPEFVFSGEFVQASIGSLDTQMIRHFFKSLAMSSRITLHMSILYGINDHHKCEGLFKALGRALRQAVEIDPRRTGVASTKGIL